jgi:nucleotide-binding universal stress UspA family protein
LIYINPQAGQKTKFALHLTQRRTNMFRNILVPIDGSALSRKTVKKAVALAKLSGAKITGFHVAPAYKFNVYADYIPPNFVMPKDFETRTRKVAEKHLEVVKKEAAAADVKAQCYFVTSDFPADAIVKAVKKHGCDLVVMASHGRSGLSKLIIGSETQKVLANTTTPVLVMR